MAVSASYDGAPAVNDDDDGKADAEFVRQSYLAYLVPLATDCGLEQVLAQCSRSGASPQAVIEGVEERESFFFDETVDVYFLLRTPYQNEDRLRDYLDRLSITFQAQIFNGHAANNRDDSPSVVETLFSGPVEDVQTPLAVVSDPARTANSDEEENDDDDDEDDEDEKDEDEDDDDGKNSDGSESSEKSDDGNSKPAQTRKRRRKPRAPTRQTFCLWKRSVLLSRPRARLHGPSVSFAAVARLQPASPAPSTRPRTARPSGPGICAAASPRDSTCSRPLAATRFLPATTRPRFRCACRPSGSPVWRPLQPPPPGGKVTTTTTTTSSLSPPARCAAAAPLPAPWSRPSTRACALRGPTTRRPPSRPSSPCSRSTSRPLSSARSR
ncbi:hypothetical protein SPI_05268 [Niveomyces insectorum RCEF 264]|uniref:Uncharacterized protein n=1 Tax=Niveomyces insectorum RCEF 264 TaxID=1081102 RepID=A0A167U4R2_9HYPO|nr:hypothetical protein SPI_05268 [Niveomyces insectorum RCEF 264]